MQQDRKRKEVASRNQALCSSHPLGDQKGESKPVLSSAGSTAVGRGSWGEVIGIRSLKPEKERQERQTSNFSREVIYLMKWTPAHLVTEKKEKILGNDT